MTLLIFKKFSAMCCMNFLKYFQGREYNIFKFEHKNIPNFLFLFRMSLYSALIEFVSIIGNMIFFS